MRKTGRNDPCPCGSGKKYKKCCLARDAVRVTSLDWRRIRRTEGELVAVLMEWAHRYYGPEAVAEAWDEFTGWQQPPPDPASMPELEPVFLPWFVFNWIPDEVYEDEMGRYPQMQVALHYLEKRGDRVDALQRRFIEAICKEPYSFFLVTGAVPGQSLDLKDLLAHREVTVVERQASEMLRGGEILFSRIVTLDQISIMVGCAGMPIPPGYFDSLLDFREWLEESFPGSPRERLLEYDLEIRDFYFELLEHLRNPAPPQVTNTDGEPMQPTRLDYRLECSPREALEVLASLSLSDVEDCLEQGKFDSQGELQEVHLHWLKKGNAKHKSWENTILGQLHIQGDRLTIEVNSQERADAIQRKIARRLGRRALFRNAVIESLESALAQAGARSEEPPAAGDEDLMSSPEAQEMVRELIRQHYREWLDSPIPALKDQTPREAARSEKGRERLEVLLLELESRDHDSSWLTPDVDELRRELGMD